MLLAGKAENFKGQYAGQNHKSVSKEYRKRAIDEARRKKRRAEKRVARRKAERAERYN